MGIWKQPWTCIPRSMTDERLGLASASEMWRIDNCHGSKILIGSLRKKHIDLSTNNIYATLGERIHASLEGYPEDLDRRSQEIRDDCDQLAGRAATEFLGGPREMLEAETLIEERLWYENEGVPFFSARPDRVYITPKRILDVNFKTGYSEEEDAASNLQLRTELVLLHVHYPQVPEIGVSIVQPMVTKTPEIAVYGLKEMHLAEAEILQIVDRATWDPKRRAGPWCRHCPARAFCPEARELATDYPMHVKSMLELPSGPPAAEMMDRLNVAYSILDAIWDAFSKKVSDDPKSVPGWHISAGKRVRTLPKDKREAFFDAALAAGFTIDDIHEAMKFSIPAFESVAAKKWELKGKALKDRINWGFNQFFETRQDAGYLEKIPKRLRDAEETV